MPPPAAAPVRGPRRRKHDRAERRPVDTLRGVLIGTRGLRTAAALLSVVSTVLSACTVDPPPAPQSTETSQAVAPPSKATQIIVAVDSIGAGFNPHLLSDQSPVNAAVSSLVLPSAFRPVADPATRDRVELDVADGTALGVAGTPTFYLDGEPLTVNSLEEFTAAVEAATQD